MFHKLDKSFCRQENQEIRKYLHLTNKDETDFIKPKWGVENELANVLHNVVKFFPEKHSYHFYTSSFQRDKFNGTSINDV